VKGHPSTVKGIDWARFGGPNLHAAADLVRVGGLGKAHGLRGEVLCHPETDFPERFLETEEVELVHPKGHRRVAISGARFHGQNLILKFQGVDSREAAEQLRGAWLGVGPDEVVDLEDGEYFHYELEGLEVLDASGQRIGRIAEVISNPAHEIYRIATEGEDILLPAVPAFVLEISLDDQKMIVQLPVYED